jgi:hypothetical protein
MRSRPGPPKMRPRPCPAAIKSAAPASLRRSPPFPPRRLSPCHPPVCTSSPAPPPREPQLFRGALRRSSPRPPDETTPSLGNGAPGAGTIVSLPAPPPAIRKAPGPRRVTSSPDRPHRGGSGETGVVLGSGPPVELVGTPRADDFRKQITCSELELDLDFGTRPRAPVSRPARMGPRASSTFPATSPTSARPRLRGPPGVAVAGDVPGSTAAQLADESRDRVDLHASSADSPYLPDHRNALAAVMKLERRSSLTGVPQWIPAAAAACARSCASYTTRAARPRPAQRRWSAMFVIAQTRKRCRTGGASGRSSRPASERLAGPARAPGPPYEDTCRSGHRC